MESLLRYLQFRAFGRGFRGHSAWVVVGVALWMLLRARQQSDVVYRTELKPGESLIVKTVKSTSSADR